MAATGRGRTSNSSLQTGEAIMAKEDGEMGGDRGPHKHRGIHELGRVEHQDR